MPQPKYYSKQPHPKPPLAFFINKATFLVPTHGFLRIEIYLPFRKLPLKGTLEKGANKAIQRNHSKKAAKNLHWIQKQQNANG
jgi:hypothetical protein